MGVACLLLVFFGGFGAHRFSLGKSGGAIAIPTIFLLAWSTLALVVGSALLVVVGL